MIFESFCQFFLPRSLSLHCFRFRFRQRLISFWRVNFQHLDVFFSCFLFRRRWCRIKSWNGFVSVTGKVQSWSVTFFSLRAKYSRAKFIHFRWFLFRQAVSRHFLCSSKNSLFQFLAFEMDCCRFRCVWRRFFKFSAFVQTFWQKFWRSLGNVNIRLKFPPPWSFFIVSGTIRISWNNMDIGGATSVLLSHKAEVKLNSLVKDNESSCVKLTWM